LTAERGVRLSAGRDGGRKPYLDNAIVLSRTRLPMCYRWFVTWGDVMKWLTAILVLLLLGLAAFPATVNAVGAWMAHRSETVQSIDYLPRDQSESNRHARHKHDSEQGPGVQHL
jgi:hypothetical protein